MLIIQQPIRHKFKQQEINHKPQINIIAVTACGLLIMYDSIDSYSIEKLLNFGCPLEKSLNLASRKVLEFFNKS